MNVEDTARARQRARLRIRELESALADRDQQIAQLREVPEASLKREQEAVTRLQDAESHAQALEDFVKGVANGRSKLAKQAKELLARTD